MASLRPASRLLSRQLNRLTSIHTLTHTSRITTHILRPTTISITPRSHFHTTRTQHKESIQDSPLSSGIPPSTLYTLEDIQTLSSQDPSTRPHRILIDVREPSELLDTGRIPSALNIPIKTAPDSFFLSPEDFEDKFGFARPGDQDEVIFYCKAGVRSKAAARLAGQAGFGGQFGEFPGSMDAWIAAGGKVQRD